MSGIYANLKRSGNIVYISIITETTNITFKLKYDLRVIVTPKTPNLPAVGVICSKSIPVFVRQPYFFHWEIHCGRVNSQV